MQAQYMIKFWLKLDTILGLKRFWLKEMIEGLGKSLTTVQDYPLSQFCNVKVSIYKRQRKLAVYDRYAQFLPNLVDRFVQTVNCTSLTVDQPLQNWQIRSTGAVDRTPSIETDSLANFDVFKTFLTSIFDL